LKIFYLIAVPLSAFICVEALAAPAVKVKTAVVDKTISKPVTAEEKAQAILDEVASIKTNDNTPIFPTRRQNAQPPSSGETSKDKQSSSNSTEVLSFREQMEERQKRSIEINNQRNAAAAKLQLLGPSITELLTRNLNSPSQNVASVCADVLGRLGNNSIKPIIDRLKQTGNAQSAVSALRQTGNDAAPDLFELLKSTNERERFAGASTLVQLMPDLSASIYFYQNSNSVILSGDDVRYICAAITTEKSMRVRRLEAEMLKKIGARVGVIDTLIKCASSETEPLVRGEVIQALGKIAATQTDKGSKACVTQLAECAKNDDFIGCKLESIREMGQAKRNADICIPVLISLLDDENLETTREAMRSLGSFGSLASPAVPALMKLIKQDSIHSQTETALTTLGNIGVEAKPALPQVIEALSSSSPEVVNGALQALGKLADDFDVSASIPKLLELLKTDDVFHRRTIFEVFCKMGPRAISAKDALIQDMELNKNDKGFVEKALQKIQGHSQ
jgi:HEAT repeat protein